MKLYIARHGQTNENARGIIQGWLDTELNEKGIAQAIQAAAAFDKPIEAIYSSDLKRAVTTAWEFRHHHEGLPYFEDVRLRERNFGDAAGTRRDQHDWEQFWSVTDRATIPNAEVIDDFTARIASFLDELQVKPYKSVLIVAHGGVLNRVQAILDPNHTHYSHANASIIEIDI